MSTAASPKLVTADELFRMPDNRYLELINGRIVEMAPAGFEHSSLAMDLAVALGTFVRENDLGIIVGESGGFILRHDPDTVRAADVAFVSKARAEQGWTSRFFDGAPDLAIEVVSPGDTWSEVHDKAALWVSAGCQSVWVVDPKRRQVSRFTPSGQWAAFGTHITDPLLPGFSLEVASLFRR